MRWMRDVTVGPSVTLVGPGRKLPGIVGSNLASNYDLGTILDFPRPKDHQ